MSNGSACFQYYLFVILWLFSVPFVFIAAILVPSLASCLGLYIYLLLPADLCRFQSCLMATCTHSCHPDPHLSLNPQGCSGRASAEQVLWDLVLGSGFKSHLLPLQVISPTPEKLKILKQVRSKIPVWEQSYTLELERLWQNLQSHPKEMDWVIRKWASFVR